MNGPLALDPFSGGVIPSADSGPVVAPPGSAMAAAMLLGETPVTPRRITPDPLLTAPRPRAIATPPPAKAKAKRATAPSPKPSR